jgi:hypothetical protein
VVSIPAVRSVDEKFIDKGYARQSSVIPDRLLLLISSTTTAANRHCNPSALQLMKLALIRLLSLREGETFANRFTENLKESRV